MTGRHLVTAVSISGAIAVVLFLLFAGRLKAGADAQGMVVVVARGICLIGAMTLVFWMFVAQVGRRSWSGVLRAIGILLIGVAGLFMEGRMDGFVSPTLTAAGVLWFASFLVAIRQNRRT